MVSKKIRIKSGFRQGDPLSKDLFNLGLNPLIKTLNNSKDIEKYKTMSNQCFLTLAFVDDLNLLVRFIRCLTNALKILEKFKFISGFTMNLEKTKGFFYNKRNIVPISSLPSIKWVRDMVILGIKFGSPEWENQQWDNMFLQFKKEVGF